MPILTLVHYPDPRLRQPAEAVDAKDQGLSTVAQDLLETMRAAPGVGITACHVGVLRRVVVVELPEWQAPQTYLNPVILWSSSEKARFTEGSVSMPGVRDEIERSVKIRLRYERIGGEAIEEELEGFAAVCLQHEIDQLNGIFFIDRLSRLKKERILKRYEKVRRSLG